MSECNSLMDLLRAAKWGNRNLDRFVREHPELATSAVRMLKSGVRNSESTVAVLTINAKTLSRIMAAQEATVSDEKPQVDDEDVARREQLATRISTYVQGALDKLDARQYWDAAKHAQLEAQFYAELIAPLVMSGAVSGGSITVGLGNHPTTNAHHSLIVGRVTLEPK